MEARGSLTVFFAVVVGVATLGFLAETASSSASTPVEPRAPAAVAEEGPVATVRSYREMRINPQGAGSGWQTDIDALIAAGPDRTDAVALEGTSKAEVLAARASRRAYDGAPPRIPHSVRQDSAAECLACHETGLRFRGLIASPMSHKPYASCTQCHVVDEAPMPGGSDLPNDPRAVANTFDGKDSPTAGTRAWSIAPPQVPHRTFMREQCDSCHGVNGADAIRSTHPWRESCEQCHAASASTELRAVVAP